MWELFFLLDWVSRDAAKLRGAVLKRVEQQTSAVEQETACHYCLLALWHCQVCSVTYSSITYSVTCSSVTRSSGIPRETGGQLCAVSSCSIVEIVCSLGDRLLLTGSMVFVFGKSFK